MSVESQNDSVGKVIIKGVLSGAAITLGGLIIGATPPGALFVGGGWLARYIWDQWPKPQDNPITAATRTLKVFSGAAVAATGAAVMVANQSCISSVHPDLCGAMHYGGAAFIAIGAVPMVIGCWRVVFG